MTDIISGHVYISNITGNVYRVVGIAYDATPYKEAKAFVVYETTDGKILSLIEKSSFAIYFKPLGGQEAANGIKEKASA